MWDSGVKRKGYVAHLHLHGRRRRRGLRCCRLRDGGRNSGRLASVVPNNVSVLVTEQGCLEK